MPVAKLRLAHLPTPLWRHDALDALIGAQVWVKRDDMSAGPAAGNKIRKLEYLLADAKARAAHTVVTCGGLQSNHARATALLCRQLQMDTLLLLRSDASQLPEPLVGNVFLDRLAGAQIRLITPAQYRDRGKLMDDAAARLEADGVHAYVIPEGGSNGLGALGYVDAMAELRIQLDAGECDAPSSFDAVVHACGSGGTAAGVALGNERFGVAQRVIAMAVCDDQAYFEKVTARVMAEACNLLGRAVSPAALEIVDRFKGPAYGIASEEQKSFIVAVARRTGLILDPVYTGKALFGLGRLPDKPRRALFIHTGGLPGLLAQSADLHAYLA
jgi:D-cysteine desulfhydrase